MVWLCKVDVLRGQASLSHPAARLGLWLLLQHRFPNVQKNHLRDQFYYRGTTIYCQKQIIAHFKSCYSCVSLASYLL
jgi:hypothetical protein